MTDKVVFTNSPQLLLSSKLESSQAILEAIQEASSIATEFTRRACRELGLNPSVDVFLSLIRFRETDFERSINDGDRKIKTEICGYYYPEEHLIVLSLPCIANRGASNIDAQKLAEILAHELIHHCQFTSGYLCDIHLNAELATLIHQVLPYHIRPEEVEAFEKQVDLAQKLQSIKGFDKLTELVRQLYLPEIKTILGGVIDYNKRVKSILDTHLKTVVESLVKLTDGLTEEREKVIENISLKMFKLAQTFFKTIHVKTFLLPVVDDNTFTTFFVTDKSFALRIMSDKKTVFNELLAQIAILDHFSNNPPLFPLYLKPNRKPTLHELNEQGIFSDSFQGLLSRQSTLTYDELIDGRIVANGFEYEVGTVRQSNVLQKICEEACTKENMKISPTLSFTDFAVLLILVGWKPGATLMIKQLEGTHCFTIKAEHSEILEPFELVICDDMKIEDKTAKISDTAKNLAEKLNHESSLKDLTAKLLKALETTS
jgi:hypothetical protein